MYVYQKYQHLKLKLKLKKNNGHNIIWSLCLLQRLICIWFAIIVIQFVFVVNKHNVINVINDYTIVGIQRERYKRLNKIPKYGLDFDLKAPTVFYLVKKIIIILQ